MGYTTEFEGVIKVTPPLSQEEMHYLTMFSDTRRMNRKNGPYFVGGVGFKGQDNEEDVIDFNQPPVGQPGLWCQWIPTEDGSGIEWDGNEKFYYAEEWMQYLIDHFFGASPIAKQVDPDAADFLQSHTFEGIIEAFGEERGDIWRLRIDESGQQVVVDSGNFNVEVTESKPVKRQTGNKRLGN